MKNPVTMLCIEDRDNHFADLQAMLATELPRLPIQVNVLYARNLATAVGLFSQADIVMTDVFFPAIPGGDEEGNGQIIVARCLAEKKPVVWVTSTFHHARKTDPLNKWGREHGFEMFDSEFAPSENKGGVNIYREGSEIPHKSWKEAFYGLLELMLMFEEGAASFIDGKMVAKGSEDWPNSSCDTRCVSDKKVIERLVTQS